MPMSLSRRSVRLGAALVLSLAGAAAGQNKVSIADWSRNVWGPASTERSSDQLLQVINSLPDVTGDSPLLDHLRQSVDSLKAGFAKREQDRTTRIAELEKELDEALAAKTDSPQAQALNYSKALKAAVELHMLSADKRALKSQPRITALVERAANAARNAETNADWLISNELFARLHGLFEDEAKYKPDVERLSSRLALLRLYVPQRLWELRDQRQKAEPNAKALPPYNPQGDDYRDKLAGVDRTLILRCVGLTQRHVEQVPLRSIIIGGIDSVDTLVTTKDLAQVFPGLGNNDEAMTKFRLFLAEAKATIQNAKSEPDLYTVETLLSRMARENAETIKIPDNAILHEFGNGAIGELDEFSAVIWPDEVARFDRLTQGKFPGVGIRIEHDELFNVRVVEPLAGRPAQRAGVKTGDLIKKVNGKSIYGVTLDQAVDLITGPVNTPVTLTIERKGEEPAPSAEMDFTMTRAQIQVASVSGWRRIGAREEDWDFYIDQGAKIGYVRITNFADRTSDELGRAMRQLRDGGVNGLILDLRHNPGGLLDQAVSIVGRFIGRGPVVLTQGPGGRIEDTQSASGSATITGVPVVVLINEGSASASEIVSGALQHYANKGMVPARLVGQRSFGKSSVQQVYTMAGTAKMKLTTQYYGIPDDGPSKLHVIHRKPGSAKWGIDPDVAVEALPSQITDALTIRRNADQWVGPQPNKPGTPETLAVPEDVLAKHLDPQLHTALVMLQSQALSRTEKQASTAPANPRPVR